MSVKLYLHAVVQFERAFQIVGRAGDLSFETFQVFERSEEFSPIRFLCFRTSKEISREVNVVLRLLLRRDRHQAIFAKGQSTQPLTKQKRGEFSPPGKSNRE